MENRLIRSITVLVLSLIFMILILFALIPVDARDVRHVDDSELVVKVDVTEEVQSAVISFQGLFEIVKEDKPQLVGKELYISYIYEICELYYPNLDPILVRAVMQAESNYIPTIQSRCGAVGLMQVIPKYHAWRMYKYHLTDIWDPYTNILVGVDFLNESYVKYGSYYQALRAYGGTDRYAKYILSLADQIRQGGGMNGKASGVYSGS